MNSHKDIRTYNRADCAVFRKTAEVFGGLSNMAPGYPVRINGVRILTVEALYQACRFPHLPEVQRKIIAQTSPMTAKMVGKPFRGDSRADWDRVRVKLMRWVLRLKLASHWSQFSALLLSTGDMAIVEDSRKDDFWGAMPSDASTLVGMNVLGRLLMELREEIKQGTELRRVELPAIPDLLLFGEVMGSVDFRQDKSQNYPMDHETSQHAVHDFSGSLFDEPTLPVTNESNQKENMESAEKQYQGLVAGLKPYPAYKESGLPWLGSCPEHWELRRTKTLFRERVQKGFPNEPLLAATQTKGVIRKEDYGTRTVTAQKDLHLLKLVEPGDYVISLRSFQGGIEVAHCRGIISPAYTVLEPRSDSSSGYFTHFFKSRQFVDSLSLFVTGIREGQNIDYERMSRSEMPFAPIDEQVAIVSFLNHANRKIENFIRAKRRMIALLNSQKQGVINRVLTRGLNPNVQLKASAIHWLGDIPMHWETLRSKYLFREVDERSEHGGETHLSMSQKLGLIPNSEIKVRRLVSSSYAGAKLCKRNDLVLNRLKAHLGVFALAPQPGLVSPDYTVLRPIRELDSRYFETLYRSPTCRGELYKRAKGIVQGFWRLYTDDFYDICMPVPPIREQQEIMDYLRGALETQDAAIARTESEIALIQEYRTRLTADIVTGKLDVREVAAKLAELPADDSADSPAEEPVEELEHEED